MSKNKQSETVEEQKDVLVYVDRSEEIYRRPNGTRYSVAIMQQPSKKEQRKILRAQKRNSY